MTKRRSPKFLFLSGMIAILFGFIGQPKSNHARIYCSQKGHSEPVWAIHFDFPVGKPDAKGYYNAQKFGENNHLGDDWNGLGGGNTDLGDTIYAIANGYILTAKDNGPGWGNVIMLKHYLTDFSTITSLYAHCDTMFISEKRKLVQRGDPIGTIGTAGGIYPAHLHFEMRSDVELTIGGGYSSDTTGYLNPTRFINEHR